MVNERPRVFNQRGRTSPEMMMHETKGKQAPTLFFEISF